MYPHVGACGARKITPGVTELSRARVHGFGRAQCRDEQIDLVACFLDVGSSYPGSAHSVRQGKEMDRCRTPKGGAVRPLKGNVSWV